MPLVKYIWLHPEGHEVSDQGLFEATEDVEAVIKSKEPIFKNPEIKLLAVSVINPFLHEHKWTRTARMGERTYYTCEHCACEAYRKFSMVYGPVGPMVREGKWKSVKYEQCHSQLKEMPPATKLFS